MDMKLRETLIISGFVGVWALTLLQFDARKQPDIPASPYYFDNMHISSEVVSSGTVAGSTTVYAISGYRLVI